jgi:hypothetical protein
LVSFVFGGTASPAKLADGEGGQSARCRRASADLKMLTEQQTPDLGKPPFEAITGPWLWREPSFFKNSSVIFIIDEEVDWGSSSKGCGGKSDRQALGQRGASGLNRL